VQKLELKPIPENGWKIQLTQVLKQSRDTKTEVKSELEKGKKQSGGSRLEALFQRLPCVGDVGRANGRILVQTDNASLHWEQ
jgi:hypothetical protein